MDERGEIDESVEANLERARRGRELWNEGGVEAAVEHFWASDIVYHEIPEMHDTGVFRGIDAVGARLNELIELGGHIQFELLAIEGRGPYVLATLKMSMKGRTGGVPMTEPIFQLSRYEGGLVRDFRSYLDADQARREFERLAAGGD